MADNPFVGPRPYRENERLFGRDEEAALLVELVVGARVVVIQSASGAGKSSLLEALLKPRLEERGFSPMPTCRVAWREEDGAAPGRIDNPLIADACRQLLGRSLPGDLSARRPLSQVLERVEARPDGDRAPEERQGLLLVFDQLEKLFQTARTAGNEARLHEFFTEVGEALRNPRRIAILALRQEYRTALDRYAGLVPTGFGNTYTLDFLRCPQGQEVLERTFGSRGVELTPGAVELLMGELRRLVASHSPTSVTYSSSGVVIPSDDLSVFVEPLHLQAHGFRLWSWLEQRNDHKVPSRLHVRDLVGMPSVADALGDYYDETVRSVAAEVHVRERDLRDWIGSELIDPSGIRRLTTKPPPGGAAAAQALERLYLVRSEARNDVVWLELSHDRLAEPARERNVHRLQEFQRRAEAYAQSHFEELLLDGKDLERAVAWAAAHPDEVNEEDDRLLADSREAELGAARSRRRRTWLAVALLAVVAVVGAWSIWLWDAAKEADAQARTIARALLANRSHAIGQKALEWSLAGETSDTAMLLAAQAGRYARRYTGTVTREPADPGARSLQPAQPAALFQLALAVTGRNAGRPSSGYRSGLLAEVPGVTAAAADATGELAATGDEHGAVVVWRQTPGGWKADGRWKGPGRPIRSLATDPRGEWLAALTEANEQQGRGGELWLLRRASGGLSAEGAPVAAGVTAVAIDTDPGGQPIVVSGDMEGRVIVRTRPAGSSPWRAETLAPVVGDQSVNAVAIGPSHATVAAAGWGRIRLWRGVDWRTGRAVRSEELVGGRRSELERIRAVALTGDEREIWAIGDVPSQPGRKSVVGAVARWDVSRPQGPGPTQAAEVFPVAELLGTLVLIHGGRLAAAGGLKSGRVRFWRSAAVDPGPVQPVSAPLGAHDGATVALWASPATEGFVSVGGDDTARLWLPPPDEPSCPTGVGLGEWVGGIAVFDPDASHRVAIASTITRGEPGLDDVPMQGIELRGVPHDRGACSSPHWTTIGPPSPGGSGQTWSRIAFAADGDSRRVAVGTPDGRLAVYNVADGTGAAAPQLTRLVQSSPAAGAYALSFIPGGERLLAASGTRIDVLRVAGGALARERSLDVPPDQGHEAGGGRVTALATTGGWIAAGTSSPAVVWLWPVDGAPSAAGPLVLPVPNGDDGDLRTLALSRDGHHVAAGFGDGRVAVWEIAPKSDPRFSSANDSAVNALAFSPEGDLLAAGGRDGVVRQWELGFEGDGHPADIDRLQAWVLNSPAHEGAIGALAFTPDGRAILTGGADRVLRVTPSMASLFRDLCAVAGRNLTKREWLEFVSDDEDTYECTCPRLDPGQGIRGGCPGVASP